MPHSFVLIRTQQFLKSRLLGIEWEYPYGLYTIDVSVLILQMMHLIFVINKSTIFNQDMAAYNSNSYINKEIVW